MKLATIIFFFLILDGPMRAMAATLPGFSTLNELEYQRESLKWEPHNRLVLARLGALREKEKQLPSDKAVQVMSDLTKAVGFLDQGKTAEGSAVLQKASAELQSLSQIFPDKRELLVRTEYSGAEKITSLSQAAPMAAEIKAAVNRGDFQKARALLNNNFENEIRITHYGMPLNEFPARIKKAQQLLAEKKTAESIKMIQSALGGLERHDLVVSLPLLRAHVYLGEVLRQDGTNSMNPRETLDLVAMADEQIQLAGVMGYAGKNEVPLLRATLKRISSDISRKKTDRAAMQKFVNAINPGQRY